MSHADPDQLAGLALDPTDGPDDVREHAATCPECAGMVAALMGVRRRAGADPLVAPPARVRAQVLAEVRAGAPPAPVALPVRDEQPPRRGVPLWLASVAAALALLAGVGLGRWGADGTEAPEAVPDPADTGTVVAAATLTALDSDAGRGEASAVQSEDTFSIRVSASELGDEPGLHEVWLINVDGVRMISIGILASGDEGEFAVPMELIDEGYRIVDISVEPDDGDPTHSGVSLARGELA
ncbi:anti-sigma factor [Nocardioides eburneiflavus]|uniref:Anti-sigma factor n=1 Tax=Nocardioides eburneiflavus TaxID=2518372 RepID=A0A4Z1BWC8_9ACTN|nr:anti-sigma factor [Nocardioides eburneiflavus]TGN61659.1 anti-sigma factor [Nocardioides eburneiflavus]TGN62544.1 anti-sigma factor [Nocardioides eburneiflavus]